MNESKDTLNWEAREEGCDVSWCFRPEQPDHAAFPPPTRTPFFCFLRCVFGGDCKGLVCGGGG